MRQFSKLEKITFVAFLNLLVILVVLWLMEKRPNRDFYIPQGYEGWVMIHYNMPDKEALKEIDGVIQLPIPESGVLETSSDLDIGWRRDKFYWMSAEGKTEIPSSVEINDEYHLYIHRHKYYARSHVHLVEQFPVGTDTMLWDETRISKESPMEVDYMPGKKTLEYLYISAKPQSILFNPPKNDNSQAIESTESRGIEEF